MAAVSHRDGFQDLFVVTADHRLMHRRNILLPPFDEGRSDWSPWRSMDAPAPVDAVTCVSSRDGTFTVFAMTADGGLICRLYPDESGHWADWQILATPGHLTALAGTHRGEERLAVLTRGRELAIRRFNGDWSRWNGDAGIVSLAWATTQPEPADLFGLTVDGRIVNWVEGAPEPWMEAAVPGDKFVSIAVGAQLVRVRPIFVARDDGSVYTRAGRRSVWTLVSSKPAVRALACSSMVDGHLSLFAVTDQGTLVHRQTWRSVSTDWAPLDD